MITGGIGGKAKLGGKIAAFALRQGIEVAGDPTCDVIQGRDVGSSLAYYTTGSLLGKGIGRVIGRGAKSIRRSVRVETPSRPAYQQLSLGALQAPWKVKNERHCSGQEQQT